MGAKYMFALPTFLQTTRAHTTVWPKGFTKKQKDRFTSTNTSIDLNVDAHYKTTGPEIWEQTNGKITHLIACSGTGGTISGAARFLKEKNPDIKVLGVDAYGSVLKKYHETKEFDSEEIYPYRIEGLGKNLIPTATDFDVIDKFIKVI